MEPVDACAVYNSRELSGTHPQCGTNRREAQHHLPNVCVFMCVRVCVYEHCMCHISAYGSTPFISPSTASLHTHQGVAIWFEVVRFIAGACVSTLQLGGVGVWNLEAMRLIETISGPI